MGLCFVYDPKGPRLYTLNTTAWLVLLLCDGRPRAKIIAGLHQEVEPLLNMEEATQHVDATLASLASMGLVRARAATKQLVSMNGELHGRKG